MILKSFVLTLIIGSIVASVVPSNPKYDGIPSISWINTSDVTPKLSINFADGSDYVAVLRRLELFSQELRLSGLTSDHLCIFAGALENVPESQVMLIGGCPGEKNFEITIKGKPFGTLKLKVSSGTVTEIPSFKEKNQGNYKIDAIATTDAQRRSKTSSTKSSSPLPSDGFIFRIGVVYDDPWLQSHGSHVESVNAVTRVVGHGQYYFYWQSLTVPVTLEIASIQYQNVRLSMGSGLDILIQFATDPSINTYVGMTTAEGGGIAYVGTICGEMKYRTAVIGKPDGSSEALGGEVLGHELGHSLGMPHDFIEPYTQPKTIRYDSQGQSCTDINALMDYDKKSVDLWSRCSVEFFTDNYNNIVASQGKFCMAPGSIQFSHGDPDTLWSMGCDFGGNDIDRVSVEGEQCGQACADNEGCTHFAYSYGNCWLKFVDGINTKMAYRVGQDAMCGIYCGHSSSDC